MNLICDACHAPVGTDGTGVTLCEGFAHYFCGECAVRLIASAGEVLAKYQDGETLVDFDVTDRNRWRAITRLAIAWVCEDRKRERATQREGGPWQLNDVQPGVNVLVRVKPSRLAEFRSIGGSNAYFTLLARGEPLLGIIQSGGTIEFSDGLTRHKASTSWFEAVATEVEPSDEPILVEGMLGELTERVITMDGGFYKIGHEVRIARVSPGGLIVNASGNGASFPIPRSAFRPYRRPDGTALNPAVDIPSAGLGRVARISCDLPGQKTYGVMVRVTGGVTPSGRISVEDSWGHRFLVPLEALDFAPDAKDPRAAAPKGRPVRVRLKPGERIELNAYGGPSVCARLNEGAVLTGSYAEGADSVVFFPPDSPGCAYVNVSMLEFVADDTAAAQAAIDSACTCSPIQLFMEMLRRCPSCQAAATAREKAAAEI